MSEIAVNADKESQTADRHSTLLAKLRASGGLWETEIRQPLLRSSNKKVDEQGLTKSELAKLREQFATAENRQDFLEVVKANPLVTIETTLVRLLVHHREQSRFWLWSFGHSQLRVPSNSHICPHQHESEGCLCPTRT